MNENDPAQRDESQPYPDFLPMARRAIQAQMLDDLRNDLARAQDELAVAAQRAAHLEARQAQIEKIIAEAAQFRAEAAHYRAEYERLRGVQGAQPTPPPLYTAGAEQEEAEPEVRITDTSGYATIAADPSAPR